MKQIRKTAVGGVITAVVLACAARVAVPAAGATAPDVAVLVQHHLKQSNVLSVASQANVMTTTIAAGRASHTAVRPLTEPPGGCLPSEDGELRPRPTGVWECQYVETVNGCFWIWVWHPNNSTISGTPASRKHAGPGRAAA